MGTSFRRRSGIRGMRRPYSIHDDDNPVDVIGHHHPFVQFHVGEMPRDALPHRPRHPPQHRVVEQQFAFVGYNRHEIRPRLGVIVSLQADGTPALSPVEGAVVFVRIGSFHERLECHTLESTMARLARRLTRSASFGWTHDEAPAMVRGLLTQVLRDCRKCHRTGRLGACLIVSQVGLVVNSAQRRPARKPGWTELLSIFSTPLTPLYSHTLTLPSPKPYAHLMPNLRLSITVEPLSPTASSRCAAFHQKAGPGNSPSAGSVEVRP